MGVGVMLIGIIWLGDVLKVDFEILFDVKIVDGIDFFCGFIFFVGDVYCSFIVGGWVGSIVGLFSIDGYDVFENEMIQIMIFDKDCWYQI